MHSPGRSTELIPRAKAPGNDVTEKHHISKKYQARTVRR
jgi:hypothetical protein